MVRLAVSASVFLCLASVAACGDDDAKGSAASASDTASYYDIGNGTASDGTYAADGQTPDTSAPYDTVPWQGADATTTSDTTTAIDPTGTADASGPSDVAGNTNISFGGAQDFGLVRALIAQGQVPHPDQLDPAGFYAEHSTPLPDPVCGERLCVQAMLGAMSNLLNGNTCTMLQLGLNSPIVADAAQRPPLTLAVVVDVSGSMIGDQKIDYVREGLAKLVNELHDDDRIAIVTYETVVHVVQPMIDVRDHRNELLNKVSALKANGSTNLYDGLEAGFRQIQANWDSGRQNRVIMLSDGNPTVGHVVTDDILEMSASYNSDGIGLTTVGLGTDFNLALMQGLAEQADGNFYFLESATAVDEVFTEELAYFTLPVAFDVSLEVHPGPFYKVDSISGTKRMTVTDGVATLVVPSVFFAHRTSASDVHEGEDGVGRRGGGSLLLLEMMPTTWTGEPPPEADVAEVTLSFREPGTDATKHESVLVHYPHPPGEMVEEGYFEGPIVTKSFVVMNLYFGIETASLLFWGGQAREARDILVQVIAAAADYEDSANDGAGDLDIRLDIDMFQDLVTVIENNAHLNDPPPPPAENPWPHD